MHEDETNDGNSSNADRDQDSDISFMNDIDEEIDTPEIEEEEEEEWIEYLNTSTDEAMQRMETAKIQCWIKAHRRKTWRPAMIIASLPEDRWVAKQLDGTLNSA